ncbi:MAG: heavy-metal-associated domain-containing protein [Alphaproteobacteria bacterium]|nr:heavy-metal-associated domain-containing protein [Alphaproteobacteria bacterium]
MTGMKCGACSSKISAALLQTDGVTAATVDPRGRHRPGGLRREQDQQRGAAQGHHGPQLPGPGQADRVLIAQGAPPIAGGVGAGTRTPSTVARASRPSRGPGTPAGCAAAPRTR